MRAILPGEPQSERQALATAHWDGLRLVTYISGNAVVILSGPQTILQTIYVDSADDLLAVAVEETTGRIAVCDEDQVFVYRPVGRDEGVLRWVQAHELENKGGLDIASLSWGSAEELLLGGSRLVLWFLPEHNGPQIIWDQALAYPTALAYLSPDSSLIASVGRHDKLVKIWRRLSYETDGTRFDVSYLPHPAAVTNLHWRKPWHVEQNVDNLLYSFCADNHVRAWTAFDPHALSVLQLAGAIDMDASIQPRRLSAGSISRRRFAFVVDSRDFATATEHAVQNSAAGRDHALEHLIEIANRSPEICVVIDGLGHMSLWGLENAGYKNKVPPSVFHIAHVDGMDIRVPQLTDPLEDYVQFCIFAGGETKSSLSILLHSFAGDIDWYDSLITNLFDTSLRHDRATMVSSLAGHNAPIQEVVRNVQGTVVLSTTEDGDVSIWRHGGSHSTAPLLRQSSFAVDGDVLDAIVLSHGRYAVILCSHGLELWDVRGAKAKRLGKCPISGKRHPKAITQSRVASERVLTSRVVVGYFEDNTAEGWEFFLPAEDTRKSNGFHEMIRPLGEVRLHVANKYNSTLTVCDNMTPLDQESDPSDIRALGYAAALAKEGTVEMVKTEEEPDSNKPRLATGDSFETNIRTPAAISASGHGKVALVHQDSSRLSIWDAVTGSWEYHHEFDGTDTLKTFAWAVSASGAALLALAFDYHIVVLGQTRYSHRSLDVAWVDLRHIRIRDFTTHPIGDLCWLKSGDLVVGSGMQFFIFKGFADTTHNHDAKPLRDIRGKINSDSAFAMLSMLGAVLPVFHPTYLFLLAMSGGVEQSNDILQTLHKQLKFFSEGDVLDSFLGISQGLASSNPTDTAHSGHTINGFLDDDPEEFVLSDVSDTLNENIGNHRIWQLTSDEKSQLQTTISVTADLTKQYRSCDANAQRYLYALYTSNGQDLPWSAITFASLSSSQEILVDLVTRHYGGKLSWEAARKSGMFCWLSDRDALLTHMENVGRTEYTANEDRNPVDCSLYYLALGKKSVLQGLWRTAIGVREKENTLKLLANNFKDKKWKATALKNAYALISKRRFHYAAAFFLLGGSLWDAVNVCIHQLEDVQLAVAISRVYDGEDSQLALTKLLMQTILPLAVESHQGRWMASWAYSTLGDRVNAVRVITRPVHQVVGRSLFDIEGMVGSLSYAANDPSLSVLYVQLRGEMLRQNKWRGVVRPREEWGFVMRCARVYMRMGADFLALELLRNWQFVAENQEMGMNGVPEPVVHRRQTFMDLEKDEDEVPIKVEKKPPPTMFEEPSANSLLDSFGF